MDIYPVIFDGEKHGELRVYGDGLLTVFEVSADIRGGVTRLSVYGGGKGWYLGVPAPKDGRLYLKRTFSAAGLRDLPETIEYAGLTGEAARAAASPEPPAKREAAEPETAGGDLLWFSTPDGVLTAFDGTRNLVAVPSDAPGAPSGIRRIIEGREYVVFPGKSNRK